MNLFLNFWNKLLLFVKVKMEQNDYISNIAYTHFENDGDGASHDYASIKANIAHLPKTMPTPAGLLIPLFDFTLHLLLFSKNFKT